MDIFIDLTFKHVLQFVPINAKEGRFHLQKLGWALLDMNPQRAADLLPKRDQLNVWTAVLLVSHTRLCSLPPMTQIM
jgi:hypothetical protein